MTRDTDLIIRWLQYISDRVAHVEALLLQSDADKQNTLRQNLAASEKLLKDAVAAATSGNTQPPATE